MKVYERKLNTTEMTKILKGCPDEFIKLLHYICGTNYNNLISRNRRIEHIKYKLMSKYDLLVFYYTQYLNFENYYK
jgi:hypothetical protein